MILSGLYVTYPKKPLQSLILTATALYCIVCSLVPPEHRFNATILLVISDIAYFYWVTPKGSGKKKVRFTLPAKKHKGHSKRTSGSRASQRSTPGMPYMPSMQPFTGQYPMQPSMQPFAGQYPQSMQPSMQPFTGQYPQSMQPTMQPSMQPMMQPSIQPTMQPTQSEPGKGRSGEPPSVIDNRHAISETDGSDQESVSTEIHSVSDTDSSISNSSIDKY